MQARGSRVRTSAYRIYCSDIEADNEFKAGVTSPRTDNTRFTPSSAAAPSSSSSRRTGDDSSRAARPLQDASPSKPRSHGAAAGDYKTPTRAGSSTSVLDSGSAGADGRSVRRAPSSVALTSPSGSSSAGVSSSSRARAQQEQQQQELQICPHEEEAKKLRKALKRAQGYLSAQAQAMLERLKEVQQKVATSSAAGATPQQQNSYAEIMNMIRGMQGSLAVAAGGSGEVDPSFLDSRAGGGGTGDREREMALDKELARAQQRIAQLEDGLAKLSVSAASSTPSARSDQLAETVRSQSAQISTLQKHLEEALNSVERLQLEKEEEGKAAQERVKKLKAKAASEYAALQESVRADLFKAEQIRDEEMRLWQDKAAQSTLQHQEHIARMQQSYEDRIKQLQQEVEDASAKASVDSVQSNGVQASAMELASTKRQLELLKSQLTEAHIKAQMAQDQLNDVREQLERERASSASKLASARDESARQLKAQRDALASELESEKEVSNSYINVANAKLAAEVARAESLQAKLQQAVIEAEAAEKRALSAVQEAEEHQPAKAALARKAEVLQQHLDRQIAASANGNAATVAEIEALKQEVHSLTAQVASANDSNARQVSKLSHEHSIALADLNALHEGLMQQVDAQHAEELASVRAALERTMEARVLEAQYDAARAASAERGDAEGTVTKLRDEIASLNATLAEVRAQAETDIKSATDRVDRVKAAAQSQFEGLKAAALAELNETRQTADEALAAAQAQWAQKEAQLQTEVQRLTAQSMDTQSAASSLLAAQVAELHAALSDTRASHQAQVAALEAEHHTAVSEAVKSALEEAEAHHKSELDHALESAEADAAETRANAEMKLRSMQTECAQLKVQLHAATLQLQETQENADARLQRMAQELQSAQAIPLRVAAILPSMHSHASSLKHTQAGLRQALGAGLQDLHSLLHAGLMQAVHISHHSQTELKDLRERYKREAAERRKLHNLVQELRGNIRVYTRLRPALQQELAAGETVVASVPPGGEEDGLLAMALSRTQSRTWAFDRVFPPEASNESVFLEVEGLVTSALDGYNVCIFAYGQTGSGKTHTMEGTEADRGINYRALDTLFARVADRSGSSGGGWRVEIGVSMLEIYREAIRDMLVPAPAGQKGRGADGGEPGPGLPVREMPGGGVYVQDLTVRRVHSLDEVLTVMRTGYRNRTTFSTNMNEHSSRSHAILTVMVVAHNPMTGQHVRGKLHLVDLAGSERIARSGAAGDRLKEAQAINKSLSALGDVIAARSEKRSHVPYRNSTLTWLLSDSLSGDSKCLMFCNISPVRSSAEESKCSLDLAARVKTVELGKAVKHVSKTPVAAGGGLSTSTAGPVGSPSAHFQSPPQALHFEEDVRQL